MPTGCSTSSRAAHHPAPPTSQLGKPPGESSCTPAAASRPPVSTLLGPYAPGSQAYCCGPAALLAAFEAETAAWPPGTATVEHFSAPDLPADRPRDRTHSSARRPASISPSSPTPPFSQASARSARTSTRPARGAFAAPARSAAGGRARPPRPHSHAGATGHPPHQLRRRVRLGAAGDRCVTTWHKVC